MTRKPRILFVNEASFLNTGYAVYGREVMRRLHKTGKYHLAELAVYGEVDSDRRFDIPWKYYGNLPTNDEEGREFNSSITNQFGEWRFERTCLDFKPDIVVDIRDWWMMEFLERSPYRPYFHLAIMPPVDSAPQQEQWLSTFMGADAVFTYSEFGRDTLLKETNNKINFIDIASPGADMDIYKPVQDKDAHRDRFGIVPDVNIVGTVMRNQARKLYPDLMEAFRLFLDQNKDTLAQRTFLYIHTSYPDSGWDIPLLLRRFNLGNKVLFTYKCANCQYVFPTFFQDAKAVCRQCGGITAHLPDTRDGLNDHEMAGVFNLFDVYVQYSVCEGFGMPQVEAAACGVPVMATDYSAMESVLKNVKGIPIKVQRMFWDSGTDSNRALPDNQDFVDKLTNLLNKPSIVRRKLGLEHWIKAKSLYNYDRTASIWEKYFDSVTLKDHQYTWASPPRIHEPNFNIPPGLNNEDFIKWCIINVWGEPQRVNSMTAMKMLRDLNYRQAIRGTGDVFFNEASYLGIQNKFQPFGHREAIDNFKRLVDKKNYFESLRLGLIKEPKPNFIKLAKEED